MGLTGTSTKPCAGGTNMRIEIRGESFPFCPYSRIAQSLPTSISHGASEFYKSGAVRRLTTGVKKWPNSDTRPADRVQQRVAMEFGVGSGLEPCRSYCVTRRGMVNNVVKCVAVLALVRARTHLGANTCAQGSLCRAHNVAVLIRPDLEELAALPLLK